MKVRFLLFLFTLLSFDAYSQDKKFSTEISYPFPFGHNLLIKPYEGTNYKGTIDLGVKYRFYTVKNVGFGASLNSSYLFFNYSDDVFASKNHNFPIQPRLFAELALGSKRNIRPSVGFGYTVMFYKLDGQNHNGLASFWQRGRNWGYNYNVGLAYDITERFFSHVQFDYLDLDLDYRSEIKHRRIMRIFKVGLGYKI